MLALLNKLKKLEDRFSDMQNKLEHTRSLLMRNLAAGAFQENTSDREGGARVTTMTVSGSSVKVGVDGVGDEIASVRAIASERHQLTDREMSSVRERSVQCP